MPELVTGDNNPSRPLAGVEIWTFKSFRIRLPKLRACLHQRNFRNRPNGLAAPVRALSHASWQQPHDWELPRDSNIFQVLEQKHDFLKSLEFLSIR